MVNLLVDSKLKRKLGTCNVDGLVSEGLKVLVPTTPIWTEEPFATVTLKIFGSS